MATAIAAHPQQKPPPQLAIDLKPLGAAPDLFADQSGSKYQQRGLVSVFWLDDAHLAAAFSANRRWSASPQPEPLRVRLIIFDLQGKQLHSRDWNIGSEGPEGAATLDLAPGPDNSILAIHQSNSAGKIPEGDFVQVLNADATLRQDFYVPATSNWVPSALPEGGLVLENYYANRHSVLAWWSGKPLKAGPKLDLPPGKEETLAGPPGTAARADCANPKLCFDVQVFSPHPSQPGKPTWTYSLPQPGMVPVPVVFLSSAALVVELRREDEKQAELVVAHPHGETAPLPALPHGFEILGVAGVSRDGGRFAVVGTADAGLCGTFNLWCSERGETLVFDVPSNRIVFLQGISAHGGASSLSPDGKRLAILDRDKLTVYALP
jgi:hypothetical protein